MSEDDDDLKVETQKDIVLEDVVGVVNGEQGHSTFPAIPIPNADAAAANPSASPAAANPNSTLESVTAIRRAAMTAPEAPADPIEISLPLDLSEPLPTPAASPKIVIPHASSRSSATPSSFSVAPTPAAPAPPPAPARAAVTVAPVPAAPVPAAPVPAAPVPAAPVPTSAAAQAPTPNLVSAIHPAPAVPAVPPETKSSAEFNIFAEKTQVQITHSTSSVRNLNIANGAAPSAAHVSTFDDKTMVQGASKMSIPKAISSAIREKVDYIRPQASHDVSYHPSDDIPDEAPKKTLADIASKVVEALPPIDRKKVSIFLGAVAVLMVALHFFFSGHDKPEVASNVLTGETTTAALAKRDPASKTVAPPIVWQNPSAGVVRQSSADFFARFHAAMQKNQN